MARWLALDKAYLKTDVLKRANLTDHDLVTHVVMTEGTVAARRGRVLHGPPRYAAYTVHIFLLTYSGMRAMRVHLDFVSGEARNERRELFRYDALASASVQEKGIRTTAVDGLETTEVAIRTTPLVAKNPPMPSSKAAKT
jgi:hypothetical protein